MSWKAGTALRKAISLAASFALAASLVPAAALPALADDDPGQQVQAAQSATQGADAASEGGDTAANAGGDYAVLGGGSDGSGSDGNADASTDGGDGKDSDPAAVNSQMAINADDVDVVSTNVALAGADAVTPVVFAYAGLTFEVNADAPTTVSWLGWSGQEPEGVLSVPASVAVGGTTYAVTRVTSGALPDDEAIDAALSEATRVQVYADAVEAAGTAPKVTSLRIPETVTDVEPAVFAAFPELASVSVVDSTGAEVAPVEADASSADASDAAPEGYVAKDGILYTADLATLVAVPAGLAGTAQLPVETTALAPGALAQARSLTAVEHPGNDSIKAYAGAVYTADMSKLLAAPAGMRGTLTLHPLTTDLAEGALYASRHVTTVSAGGLVQRVATAAYDDKGMCVALPALPDGVTAEAAADDNGDGTEEGSEDDGESDLAGVDEANASNQAAEDAAPTQPIAALIPEGADASPWEAAGAAVSTGTAPTPAAGGADPASDSTKPNAGEPALSYTLTDGYTLEVSWGGDYGTAPATVSIPATAKVGGLDYTVTSVAPFAFSNQTALERVVIPDTVTSIQNGAFAECASLKSISLGSGVSSIGAKAFKGTALDVLVLPESVKYVDDEALSTNAQTTIIALGDVATVDPRAMLQTSGTTAYVPQASAGAWQEAAGLPAAGNHVQPYEVKLGKGDYELGVGETVSLLDGGALRAPGATKASWSYRASYVSVDNAGTLTANAVGTTAVQASLSVAVGSTTYIMARDTARVRVIAPAGTAAPEATGDSSVVDLTGDVETTVDADIDAITEAANKNSYDINGITNEDVKLTLTPVEQGVEASEKEDADKNDGGTTADEPANSGGVTEPAESTGSSGMLNGTLELEPAGEEPEAIFGRVFTGRATPSGKAEPVVTDIAKAQRTAREAAQTEETQNNASEAAQTAEAQRNTTRVGDTAVSISGDPTTDPDTIVRDSVWYKYRMVPVEEKDRDRIPNLEGFGIYISQYDYANGTRKPVSDITLPDAVEINGKTYPVIGIDGIQDGGQGGFCNCKDMTSVTIPASVCNIESSAFRGCVSLTRVNFANESLLEAIEAAAFSGTKLESLKLPNGLKTIVPYDSHGDVQWSPFAYDKTMTKIDASSNAYFYNLADGSLYSGPNSPRPNEAVWIPYANEQEVREECFGIESLGSMLLMLRQVQAHVVPSTVSSAGVHLYQPDGEPNCVDEILALSSDTGFIDSVALGYLEHDLNLYYVVDDAGKSTWGDLSDKANYLHKVKVDLTLDKSAIALNASDETTVEVTATTPFEADSSFLKNNMLALKLVDDAGKAVTSFKNITISNSTIDGNTLKATITVPSDFSTSTLNNIDVALTYNKHNCEGGAKADGSCDFGHLAKEGMTTCDYGKVLAKQNVKISPKSGYLPTVNYSVGEDGTYTFGNAVTADDDRYSWTFENGILTISNPKNDANGTKYAIADFGWVRLKVDEDYDDPKTSEVEQPTVPQADREKMGELALNKNENGENLYLAEHWGPLRAEITKVEMSPTLKAQNMDAWFRECVNLVDVSKVVFPEGVETLNYVFQTCKRIGSLPSDLTIPASAKSLQNLFCDAIALNKLPNNFITADNTKLLAMRGSFARTRINDLGSGFRFPDNGNLYCIRDAFSGCSNLSYLPDTLALPSSIQDVGGVFVNCPNLTTIPSAFNLSNITVDDLSSMFTIYNSLFPDPVPTYYGGSDETLISLTYWGAKANLSDGTKYHRILTTKDDPTVGKVVFQTAKIVNKKVEGDWERHSIQTPNATGTVVEPAVKDRSSENLVFSLWYTDEECTNPVDFGAPIASQVTPDASGAYNLYGAYRPGVNNEGASGGPLPSFAVLLDGGMANQAAKGANWWSIDSDGNLYIRGCGTVEDLWGGLDITDETSSDVTKLTGYWQSYRNDIKNVYMMPSTDAVNCDYWFFGMKNLQKFNSDHLPKSAKSLCGTFAYAGANLPSTPATGGSGTGGTEAGGTEGSGESGSGSGTDADTGSGTSTSGTTKISNFSLAAKTSDDTVRYIPVGVTDTSHMFYKSSIKMLPFGFTMGNGVQNVNGMFEGATSLKELTGGFTLPTTVKDARRMFAGTTAFESLPSGFTLPGGAMLGEMFYNSGILSLPEGFSVPTDARDSGMSTVSSPVTQTKDTDGNTVETVTPVALGKYGNMFTGCWRLTSLPSSFAFDPTLAKECSGKDDKPGFMMYNGPTNEGFQASDELLKTYYGGDNSDVLNYDWMSQNRVLITDPSAMGVTVTYNLMGEDGTYETYNTFTLSAEQAIPHLAGIDATGHGFVGWCVDEACEVPFVFNDKQTASQWSAANGNAKSLTLYGREVIHGTYKAYDEAGNPVNEDNWGRDLEGELALTADSPGMNTPSTDDDSAAWWYITKNGELVIDGQDGKSNYMLFRSGEWVKVGSGYLPYEGNADKVTYEADDTQADKKKKDEYGRPIPTNRYTLHPTIAASNFAWKWGSTSWSDITKNEWGPYRAMVRSAKMMPGLLAEDQSCWFARMNENGADANIEIVENQDDFDGLRYADVYITDRSVNADTMLGWNYALTELGPGFHVPMDGMLEGMRGVFVWDVALLRLPDSYTMPITVKHARNFFEGMTSMTALPEGFDFSPNLDGELDYFFSVTSSLKSLPANFKLPTNTCSLTGFFKQSGIQSLPEGFTIPAHVGSVNQMFVDCESLTSLPAGFKFEVSTSDEDNNRYWWDSTKQPPDWIPCKNVDVSAMFRNCSSLVSFPESFNLNEIEVRTERSNYDIKTPDYRLLEAVYLAVEDTGYSETNKLTTYVSSYDKFKPKNMTVDSSTTVEDAVVEVFGNAHRDLKLIGEASEPKVAYYLPKKIETSLTEFATTPYTTVLTRTIDGVKKRVPENEGLFYDGYLFEGWYIDTGLNTKFNFNKAVDDQGVDNNNQQIFKPSSDGTYHLYAKYINVSEAKPLPAIRLSDGASFSAAQQSGENVYATWRITRDSVLEIKTAEGYVVDGNAMADSIADNGYWLLNRTSIRVIDTTGATINGSMASWFSGFTALTDINFLRPKGAITSMASLLQGCSSITAIPGTFIVPEGVTDCSSMFNGCSALTTVDSSFALPSTTTSISELFRDCTSLTTFPAGIFAKIKDGSAAGSARGEGVFRACKALEEIPAGFSIPTGIKEYTGFFFDCLSLRTIPSDFRLPNDAVDVAAFFGNCKRLSAVPAGFTIPATATRADWMFQGCETLTSIPAGFSISSASADYMFRGCDKLAELPSSLDVSGFESMPSYMFTDYDAELDGDEAAQHPKYDPSITTTVFVGSEEELANKMWAASASELSGITDTHEKAQKVKEFWKEEYGRTLICLDDKTEIEGQGYKAVTLKTRKVPVNENPATIGDNYASIWNSTDAKYEIKTTKVLAKAVYKKNSEGADTSEIESYVLDKPEIPVEYGYEAFGWYTSPQGTGEAFGAEPKRYLTADEEELTLYAMYKVQLKVDVPLDVTIFMNSTGTDTFFDATDKVVNRTVMPAYVVGVDTHKGDALYQVYDVSKLNESDAKSPRLQITMDNGTGTTRTYKAPLDMTFEQVKADKMAGSTNYDTAFPYELPKASVTTPETETAVKFSLTQPLKSRPNGAFTLQLTTVTWNVSLLADGGQGSWVTPES